MKKNNQSGFIQVHTLFTIALAMIIFFTTAFGFITTQANSSMRKESLVQATEFQSRTLSLTRVLFQLNKISTVLRIAVYALRAAQAVAAAAGQLHVVAAIQRVIKIIENIQKGMGQIQESLIKIIKGYLVTQHGLILFNLGRISIDNKSNKINRLMQLILIPYAKKAPKLAIHPDSKSDKFPNYEWDDDAEEKLEMAYFWNISILTNKSFQKYLNWFGYFNHFCAVRPNLESESEWKLRIIMDKPLSNSRSR